MTILYHGSYLPVPKPLAKAGRKNLDFGQGFYLTSILEQPNRGPKLLQVGMDAQQSLW